MQRSLSRLWEFLKRPVVSLALRVAVSGILLFFLFRLAVVEKIADVFSRISLPYLALYFLFYFLGVVLMAVRWRVLLQAWDIEQGFALLFRRIMTGLFLNNFFPAGWAAMLTVSCPAVRTPAGRRTSPRRSFMTGC